jgi:alcohol dehydrogenase
MRAYVMTGYGVFSDAVRLVELPDPKPSADEIVCELKAAALNPIDLKTVEGALKRINTYDLPHAIGFDGSGIVRQVGNRVSAFSVGDEVFVRASRERIGTFAEQIALPAAYFAKKPKNISFEAAASLPLVGLTIVQGLVDRARAKKGQRILVHAGSGGVGTFAIQYAKYLGMHVTATTSSRNAEFVRDLGADVVISYDKSDYRNEPANYDIVLDTLGGDFTLDAFGVTNRGGTVVSIVGPPDHQFGSQVGAGLLARSVMRFMGRKVFAASRKTGVTYHRFLTTSDGEQLAEIARLVDQGHIRPIVDRILPFDELPQALAYLATGRARGKVVISM